MRRKRAGSSNIVLPTPGKKFHNIDTWCAESGNAIADSGTKNDRLKKLHKKTPVVANNWCRAFSSKTIWPKITQQETHRRIYTRPNDQMLAKFCFGKIYSPKFIPAKCRSEKSVKHLSIKCFSVKRRGTQQMRPTCHFPELSRRDKL